MYPGPGYSDVLLVCFIIITIIIIYYKIIILFTKMYKINTLVF